MAGFTYAFILLRITRRGRAVREQVVDCLVVDLLVAQGQAERGLPASRRRRVEVADAREQVVQRAGDDTPILVRDDVAHGQLLLVGLRFEPRAHDGVGLPRVGHAEREQQRRFSKRITAPVGIGRREQPLHQWRGNSVVHDALAGRRAEDPAVRVLLHAAHLHTRR